MVRCHWADWFRIGAGNGLLNRQRRTSCGILLHADTGLMLTAPLHFSEHPGLYCPLKWGPGLRKPSSLACACARVQLRAGEVCEHNKTCVHLHGTWVCLCVLFGHHRTYEASGQCGVRLSVVVLWPLCPKFGSHRGFWNTALCVSYPSSSSRVWEITFFRSAKDGREPAQTLIFSNAPLSSVGWDLYRKTALQRCWLSVPIAKYLFGLCFCSLSILLILSTFW